jgi:hypothetical protein
MSDVVRWKDFDKLHVIRRLRELHHLTADQGGVGAVEHWPRVLLSSAPG